MKKLTEREQFAKELLDALDTIESRKLPVVEQIVQGIKQFIRDLRDRKI